MLCHSIRMHCSRKKNERKMGVTSTTAQKHQSQWFPHGLSTSTAGMPPRPEQHQTEHPHLRGSPIRIPLATKMEATIRKKIIGKDELKAWIIARATKPLPCFYIDVRANPQSQTQATESVTGRRPSRRRLGVAWQRQWQQQWAATLAATSMMRLEKKNRVL